MQKCVKLSLDSSSVQFLCAKDKRLAKVIKTVGAIYYCPHSDNPYAHLVHEIVEQMLSIKVGAIIYSRIEQLCNGSITPEAISSLSDFEIRACGTSNAKIASIRDLTKAVQDKKLIFEDLADLEDKEVISTLTRIKGIGNWTAKMYLIFILDRQDILPFEDGAFIQAYRWLYKTNDISPSSIKKRCRKWSPYSSIAARYLYRALDLGLTKETFHLFK